MACESLKGEVGSGECLTLLYVAIYHVRRRLSSVLHCAALCLRKGLCAALVPDQGPRLNGLLSKFTAGFFTPDRQKCLFGFVPHVKVLRMLHGHAKGPGTRTGMS